MLLFRHRAATTAHLHSMLRPRPHPVYLRRCLRALRDAGLAESASRAHHPSVWALSRQGQGLVLSWPQFRGQHRYRPVGGNGGGRSTHTLTVTRTAVVFHEDAAVRGDEFTGMDWSVEVAHSIRDGAADGDRMLIADALMRYTRTSPHRSLLRAFVEVDRATESSERLASKLISYARYHSGHPAAGSRRTGTEQSGIAPWQRSYTAFPRILFVLTGAGERALAQRIADLQAMARQHPLVAHLTAQVPVGAAVLEHLEEQGASAPVWSPVGVRGPLQNWMDL
ncbi:replication-relaxation family protein [Streptomyces sp. ET3-23]|uniref:replication-relaxation family protein n=1 Tax=Streptomyces sp. ET3-23 TaxID=2885643 RepID=UPI001D11DA75|nr:replication-relaxation family protein [Streptomyces sp. ET3-23]MCC2280563.1 replication-relaxation family protein [Streptomyces sp. ET3-23]